MVKVVLEYRQQLPHTYLEITMHMVIKKMTMSRLGCDTEWRRHAHVVKQRFVLSPIVGGLEVKLKDIAESVSAW